MNFECDKLFLEYNKDNLEYIIKRKDNSFFSTFLYTFGIENEADRKKDWETDKIQTNKTRNNIFWRFVTIKYKDDILKYFKCDELFKAKGDNDFSYGIDFDDLVIKNMDEDQVIQILNGKKE